MAARYVMLMLMLTLEGIFPCKMLIEDESLMPDKVSTKVFIDDHDVKCDQAVSDYCFFSFDYDNGDGSWS